MRHDNEPKKVEPLTLTWVNGSLDSGELERAMQALKDVIEDHDRLVGYVKTMEGGIELLQGRIDQELIARHNNKS